MFLTNRQISWMVLRAGCGTKALSCPPILFIKSISRFYECLNFFNVPCIKKHILKERTTPLSQKDLLQILFFLNRLILYLFIYLEKKEITNHSTMPKKKLLINEK